MLKAKIIFAGITLCQSDPCARLDVGLNINIGSYSHGEYCADLFWAEPGQMGGIHTILNSNHFEHPVTISYAFEMYPETADRVITGPVFSTVLLGNWASQTSDLSRTLKKVAQRYPIADAVFLIGTGLTRVAEPSHLCEHFAANYLPSWSVFYPIVGENKRGEPPHLDCPSREWSQSESNFSFHRWKPDHGLSICAWFIDTNPLAWTARSAHWLDGSITRHKPRCLWTLVVGYHSVYSASGGAERLQQSLLPIMNKHRINVYLSSIERQTQVLKNPEEDTFYIISGASGKVCEDIVKHPFLDSPIVARVGFVHLEFTRKKVTYSFHFGDNTVLASPYDSGSIYSPINTLIETPGDGSSIRLLAFGDWGQAGAQWEQTLNLIRKRSHNDHVLLLGDNFYPSGVESELDPKWSQFTDLASVWAAPSFLAILGNHDYEGSVDAQVQAPGWVMPQEYYFKRIVKGGINVCLWALDTNRFANRQVKWLAASVTAEQGCTFKIAMGHHPIVTGGMYFKHSTTRNMHAKLFPLLNGFNMYISGHEHMSQVLRDPETGMLFVIAGATSDLLSGADRDSLPGHPWEIFTNTRELAVFEMEFNTDSVTLSFQSVKKRIWTTII